MKKPSRRAVVRTGVWAVPVVAAAAPAFPASTTPPVDIEQMGSARKLAGRGAHHGETLYDYRMVVTFDNTTASPQVVALIDLTVGGKAVTGFPTGSEITLQPGSNQQVLVVTGPASSERTATITYQYGGNIVTRTVAFPDLNPYTCESQGADLIDPASECA
jgi:hypothetical protein